MTNAADRLEKMGHDLTLDLPDEEWNGTAYESTGRDIELLRNAAKLVRACKARHPHQCDCEGGLEPFQDEVCEAVAKLEQTDEST